MTRFRSWLIRGFFLALLLLWVVGWAVSTCYYVWGRYTRGGKVLEGAVSLGVVGFSWERGAPVADGWHGVLTPHPFRLADSDFWWERESFADASFTYSFFRLVGFYYAYDSHSQALAPPFVRHRVSVPFWFLLLVSGVALRWAWRKTRPQPSPATAFPVETKGGQL